MIWSDLGETEIFCYTPEQPRLYQGRDLRMILHHYVDETWLQQLTIWWIPDAWNHEKWRSESSDNHTHFFGLARPPALRKF